VSPDEGHTVHESTAGPDELNRLVRDVSQELAIDSEFLFGLLRLDDWSFVIQLHALVEAAVTHLLVHSTREGRLQTFYQRLALQNERTGKLAVVSALELLEPWHIRHIKALSGLRNRLAHDIRMVSFSLSDDIADDSRADEFVGQFSGGSIGEKDRPSWRPILRRDPKFFVWMQAIIVTGHVYLSATRARIARDVTQLKVDQGMAVDGLLAAIRDSVERTGELTFRRKGT